MVKKSKATSGNINSNAEDLLGLDGSDWLEEVTQKLVIKTPNSTPRKPKIRKTISESVQTIKATNKIPIAIDLRSHSEPLIKPDRPANLTGHTPTKCKFRYCQLVHHSSKTASTDSSRPFIVTEQPELIWISSEEDDAGDTESDSDSSSIFDRGSGPSLQTTISSIASFIPESPSKAILSRPNSGLSPRACHTVPRPVDCDKFSVSPSRSRSYIPILPFDNEPYTSSSDLLSPSPSTLLSSSPISLSPTALKPPQTTSRKYFIIAHDKETQKLFDNIKGPVPWGAQYELARGVILKEWTWEDVREKVHNFAGKSDAEVMHLVCYVMKGVPFPKLLKNDIGQESDREQLALLENRGRGLGLLGHFQDVDNWFGGQIQQIATLRETARFTLFLQLEPLEMRRSTRFARQFGSRRVLQVRIADDFLRAQARERTIRFLSRKFVLNGRVFAPTPPKEGAVYLVEIGEDYERTSMSKFGDQHRKSLREVLEWHNPMALNSQQPISKYAARAALALSNTVPALIFEVEDIHFIEDIIASDCQENKPPAHKVLTDGCGFMNEAALKAIATALNYPCRPTAVQGRIAGSKGLWTIHPDKSVNTSEIPQIWIRDSQRKIIYPHFDSSSKHYSSLDRAHRIFDLCHAALPSLSTTGPTVSLKKQSVLNIWANGAPVELFKELMKKGLEEMIEPLMQWDGQFAMPALWDAINKTGKVSHIRTARAGAGMARALGLAGRDYSKEGSTRSETGAMSPIFSSTVTGRNEFSGAPMGLHETAIELVQAGFHPARDSILWSTLQKVLEFTVQGAIDKCNIPLPEGSSATAFVIPGEYHPLGVLQENEIYYRSSTPIRDPNTQTLFHVITGEVLVGQISTQSHLRHPEGKPSLQAVNDHASSFQFYPKVIAVDKPELAPWSDVFIVPIKPSDSGGQGLVSMMSKCSGGDQDGDDLCGTWLDSLVKSFKESPLVLEPENISSEFEDRVQKLEGFLAQIATGPDAEHDLISAFLKSLTDSNVGLYDKFHESVVRHDGYTSDEALRLAFLFNRLLDAPKTGAVLRTEVMQKDKKRDRDIKQSLEGRAQSGSQASFIFDELETFGQNLLKTTMAKFQQLPPLSERSYMLLEPYKMAQNLCQFGSIPADALAKIAESSESDPRKVERILLEARRSDLRSLEHHVDQAFLKFCSIARTNRDFEEKKKQKKGKSSQIDVMDPAVALYAQEIHGLTNTLPNIEQVKASYAYSKGKTFNFGKTVAFRTLCEIQVAALSEGGAPCSRILDQVKSVSGGARRLFQQ
ncbi:RNA dependent RNA polymerase-domain-containing protein [Lentinula guzmanii]|uniref:RNA-dependent RNA polymerase n=1 Tax=Lentinula guzmanii TaxID=2804957 RepID=A0AA38MZP4_9AGAR|nr:RNA dependent RNA polymerase-domain-containing protein [Lentinula guzmanii]